MAPSERQNTLKQGLELELNVKSCDGHQSLSWEGASLPWRLLDLSLLSLLLELRGHNSNSVIVTKPVQSWPGCDFGPSPSLSWTLRQQKPWEKALAWKSLLAQAGLVWLLSRRTGHVFSGKWAGHIYSEEWFKVLGRCDQVLGKLKKMWMRPQAAASWVKYLWMVKWRFYSSCCFSHCSPPWTNNLSMLNLMGITHLQRENTWYFLKSVLFWTWTTIIIQSVFKTRVNLWA